MQQPCSVCQNDRMLLIKATKFSCCLWLCPLRSPMLLTELLSWGVHHRVASIDWLIDGLMDWGANLDCKYCENNFWNRFQPPVVIRRNILSVLKPHIGNIICLLCLYIDIYLPFMVKKKKKLELVHICSIFQNLSQDFLKSSHKFWVIPFVYWSP